MIRCYAIFDSLQFARQSTPLVRRLRLCEVIYIEAKPHNMAKKAVKLPGIQSYFATTIDPIDASMEDQADHALVRLICGLDLPLQMTARQEFTEFVKAVQKAPKSYVTPKPTKLHGLIKKRDEKIQVDIKDIMCTALRCSTYCLGQLNNTSIE